MVLYPSRCNWFSIIWLIYRVVKAQSFLRFGIWFPRWHGSRSAQRRQCSVAHSARTQCLWKLRFDWLWVPTACATPPQTPVSTVPSVACYYRLELQLHTYLMQKNSLDLSKCFFTFLSLSTVWSRVWGYFEEGELFCHIGAHLAICIGQSCGKGFLSHLSHPASKRIWHEPTHGLGKLWHTEAYFCCCSFNGSEPGSCSVQQVKCCDPQAEAGIDNHLVLLVKVARQKLLKQCKGYLLCIS